MSNWMIENNGKKFSYSHVDLNYQLEVDKHGKDQLQITIKWYSGKYEEKQEFVEAYLSGRNLEVFKEWLIGNTRTEDCTWCGDTLTDDNQGLGSVCKECTE